jgi:hypothetical protein
MCAVDLRTRDRHASSTTACLHTNSVSEEACSAKRSRKKKKLNQGHKDDRDVVREVEHEFWR